MQGYSSRIVGSPPLLWDGWRVRYYKHSSLSRDTPLSLGAHRRELRRERLGHLPEGV